MKKLVTLIALLALTWVSFAQDNGIIYTDFEPDWCITPRWFGSRDTIKFDFDRDNEIDLMIELYNDREPEVGFFPSDGWEYRTKIDCTIHAPITYDTLVSTAPYGWRATNLVVSCVVFDKRKFGVRKVVNDSTFCYGWFSYARIFPPRSRNDVQEFNTFYICIDDMAYCTVPDYPLRWGQTTMTSVAEAVDDDFVFLYPNPTTGIVNIKGERLSRAEIFNNLGQRIALIHSSDDEFSVDMKGLPSGLYYAAIIDAEGRRYTRKIVKE